MRYLLLLFGLVIGNYVFQLFQEEPNWWSAFERSFFQSLAVLCCYMIRERSVEKVPLEMGDQ